MKHVVLRSPVLTSSGYGVHSRQLARWLLSRSDIKVEFATLPWGATPWYVDRNALDGLVGQVMDRSVKPDTKCDVSIQLQLPDEFDPSLAPVNIGITAGVETDKCNPTWIDACNRMSMVVVPSNHVKACLTNTGNVTVPLHVVPEAYSDACINPDGPTLGDFSTPFNFLLFGQLTGNNPENDRKNTFYTLKWLCEAFKDDPHVGIVIKTNAGRNTRADRHMTRGVIQAVLNEARKGPNPRIHLLHGDMSDAEVASLYHHTQVKALVALTRGEGFGLPILEAAASGLPVIATNWSGHLDFLKHGKFVSIYHQLVPVHASRLDNRIFLNGMRWANASEDDFKKRVMKFRQSPAIPTQWATELRQKLLPLYSFNAVAQQYDALLGRYL